MPSPMKFILIIFTLGFIAGSGCSVKPPDNMEYSLRQQDSKMKAAVKRSKARSEKREDWWEGYKRRNDARYDRWIDGIMD